MPLVLLVEGSDDVHVIKHVLRALGEEIDEHKEITNCEGIGSLLNDDLPLALSKLRYSAIGIIVDANSDLSARWQSIRDRLRNAGYDVPGVPDPGGTIIRGRKTIGVWLMPDNASPGTLEHFIEQLGATDVPLWEFARDAVSRIPDEKRRFAKTATIKSELHTYLAWREEPGTPLGSAIAKKYFDAHSTAADSFVTWFQQLRNA
ncbi:MAG TPA: DUF3226 domain-containing protein [Thermoanaerobaculia bacterium]|nr:DUF3226 domain-containing protein [Thermoanaerobaculia bacterium]